jgi:integrase
MFTDYSYRLHYGHYVDIVGVTGSIPVAPTTACGCATPSGVVTLPPPPALPVAKAPLPLTVDAELRALVEKYRDTVSPRKRGKDMERYVLNAFLRDPMCSIPIKELRRSHFVHYRDCRLAQGKLKPGSLKRQLDILHHMFELAKEDWELEVENPIERLRLSQSKKRERRLSKTEISRLLEALSETRNPYLEPMILFALETGMRREELTRIEWQHVGENSLTVSLTKNGEARVLPLTSRALKILYQLRERKEERPFNTTPRAITLAWRRLTKRAGIKDLRFHDLRHEAISSFFERDLTMPEVMSISGHKDTRMLMRYAHADKKKLLAKLEKREGA